MRPFPVVDATSWDLESDEQMGKKPKAWLRDPEGQLWLYKARTMNTTASGAYPKGDDWTEKVASEVAALLGVPAARVELATRGGDPGTVSLNIAPRLDLVLGNDFLAGRYEDYDTTQRHHILGYTVERVLGVLADVGSPPGTRLDLGGAGYFAGFLMLDALVGNTDRHHENWGLVTTDHLRLAPSFDHASCLGFQLSDDQRAQRLNDPTGGGIQRWVDGARTPFESQPSTFAAARYALEFVGSTVREAWRASLLEVTEEMLEVVDRLPPRVISEVTRRFAKELLARNHHVLVTPSG